MMKNSINEICKQVPVIPVLVVNDTKQAKVLAETLIDAGLHVLEVTLRTPVALDVIRIMSEIPGGIIGAGTVLSPQDLIAAKGAGADFVVSPGSTTDLLQSAISENMPILPGASTASEVMKLEAAGFNVLKLFPAESVGGIPLLKSLYGPFPNVTFCPTGGISENNYRKYLALPNVACVGGSWITPELMLAENNWTSVRNIAERVTNIGD